MQIPAGPNQIAQTYMGSMNTLGQKVDQASKNPGIAPDFVGLLQAYGKTLSGAQAAKNYMATQEAIALAKQGPNGKPPTILEQILMANRQQQAQPQQPQGLPGIAPDETETVQAAQGGYLRRGIDHLPANFKFGGGGIVAFQEGGVSSSNLDTEIAEAKNRLEAAAAMGDLRAVKDIGVEIQQLLSTKDRPKPAAPEPQPTGLRNTMQEFEEATAPPLAKPAEKQSIGRIVRSNVPLSGDSLATLFNRMREQGQDRLNITKPWNSPDVGREREVNLPQTPPASAAPAAPAAAPAALSPEMAGPPKQDFASHMEGGVKQLMSQNPAAEAAAATERYRKASGIDALLNKQEEEKHSLAKLYAEQQANRPAGWRTWAQAFAKANPRMGLGYALGEGGAGYDKALAAEMAEDRALAKDIYGLGADITGKRVELGKSAAAAGEAAHKTASDSVEKGVTAGVNLVGSGRQLEGVLAQAQANLQRIAADKQLQLLARQDTQYGIAVSRLADGVAKAEKLKESDAYKKALQGITQYEQQFASAQKNKPNLTEQDFIKQQGPLYKAYQQHIQVKTRIDNAAIDIVAPLEAEVKRRENVLMGLSAPQASAPSTGAGGLRSSINSDKAKEWIAKNPNDPKAAEIRKYLGITN